MNDFLVIQITNYLTKCCDCSKNTIKKYVEFVLIIIFFPSNIDKENKILNKILKGKYKHAKVIMDCINHIKELVYDPILWQCRKNTIQFLCSLNHIGTLKDDGFMIIFTKMLNKAMDIDYL